MNDQELLTSLVGELKQMLDAGDGLALRNLRTSAEIDISPQAVWMLIASLQLSLRHPDNDGTTATGMRTLLCWLRRQFIKPGSAMEQLFLLGGS